MVSRRKFLETTGLTCAALAAQGLLPTWARAATGFAAADRKRQGNADIIDLTIAQTTVNIEGRKSRQAITVNGTIPAPLVRLQEGRDAILRVTNNLDEDTSIHWHGILLPFRMDGVPGVTFGGIKPGETFTYKFPVRQAGTYWYHSHSGLQEQLGHYGPLVIDPKGAEPIPYDREHVIVLSDWMFENPYSAFRKLKVSDGYFSYNKRTIGDFFDSITKNGYQATMADRKMWNKMRMSPRDLLDITGATYTYLANGHGPEENWTGLFKPGERVRLRIINASAMSIFDVRIPGLEMTVIEADGQPVQPVGTDEIRLGVAEIYDVIVQPKESKAYTFFAETIDRSGYARGTLAPRVGMVAAIPPSRQIAERDHSAMGMDMSGMDHGAMKMEGMDHSSMDMSGMDHGAMKMEGVDHSKMKMDHGAMDMPMTENKKKTKHDHGPGAAMLADSPISRLSEPGIGLGDDGRRVLVYSDLKARKPWPDNRPPSREVELHLTGNMERYMWSFDGKKFSEVNDAIHFKNGERLRLTMVNDTMMDHPIHLHGMWMELENGNGDLRPRKHTILIKPGEKVSSLITPDEAGDWAFHCHLLFHMKAGMFRVVSVA